MFIKTTLCMLTLIATIPEAPTSEETTPEATVAAAAVAISARHKKTDDRYSWVPNESETKIGLLVKAKGILELDTRGSKVTRISDDRGLDLTGKAKGGFSYWKSIAKDGNSAIVTATVSTLPTPGAKTLSLEATIRARLTQGTETSSSPFVKAEKGARFKVANQELSIVEKSQKRGETGLTLMGSLDLGAIAAVRFLDKDLNEIRSHRSSRTQTVGAGTSIRTWYFKKDVEAFTMVITMHTGTKWCMIPVRLTVPLGSASRS